MSMRVAFKLTLPLAFFGYAMFANVALFQSPVVVPNLGSVFSGEMTKAVDQLYRDGLMHRDPAVGWIGATRYALLNEGRSGVVAGQKGWLFSDEEFRAVDTSGKAYDATLRWINEVDQTLAGHGVDLVVVPLASKLDVARQHGLAPEQALEQQRLYDGFVDELADGGVTVVSSRDALLNVAKPFLKTDTHWTVEGATAVAEAVAMSSTALLGDQQVDVTPLPTKTFAGDLVSFVTSDSIAPFVGLAAETVTPFEATLLNDASATLDLFGDSGPAPLALVGTSYSANTNWSFASALSLALKQDLLNYAQEGRGPVAPMRDFLNQLDPAALPAAVIWEFPVRYLTDPKLMSEEHSDEQ